jgi:hypothetical protein
VVFPLNSTTVWKRQCKTPSVGLGLFRLAASHIDAIATIVIGGTGR